MKKILLWFLCCGSLWGADFRAGIGRVKITPELPIWMSGYAARTRPADSVLADLWAKALVLEDGRGKRIVLVTTDLIGLPSSVTAEVAGRLKQRHGLQRPELLLNSSHTHSGPVVRPNLKVLYDLNPADEQAAVRYSRDLADKLVAAVSEAMARLQPATIAYSHATVSFGVNRREPTASGMRIGVNPSGPVDPEVPVLQVRNGAGKLLAVLFGYACHNTTLGGDSYSINGDYAGFAQSELEERHPETTALFFMLCGADQNPSPRGTVELAREYGKKLAEAVDLALTKDAIPVSSAIRSAYQEPELEFEPQSKAVFEEELKSPNQYQQRRARLMLEAFESGRPVRTIHYPVQAVGLGKELFLLALGGEVVVDYPLRIKREYAGRNLVVAGYSNEVMAYIPSRRVLQEGGYEAVESMIYYGQPGPFREDVEERVFQAIHAVLKSVGAGRAKP